MGKRAFTLTEVLVTLSVAGVLTAILVPALGRGRAECKRIACMSNQRQLWAAAQVYAGENGDYYPMAYIDDPNPYDSTAINVCWDFTVTNNAETGISTKAGLLWPGQTIAKIQQCPEFKGNANSNDPYTGYNYNISYIGHGSGETVKTSAKVEQVRKPDQCALFGDGEYSDGANKYMRAPFKSSEDKFYSRTAGTQGYRHCGATNVAWCDGHASSQRELYTDTSEGGGKARLETYNNTAKVKIGFLSPDNSAYDLD
jgi:prepilin-type N-terminal cleavage/methylation domain-containing protein/prepilin-type processing-associated H-X9-DG protein